MLKTKIKAFILCRLIELSLLLHFQWAPFKVFIFHSKLDLSLITSLSKLCDENPSIIIKPWGKFKGEE